MLGPISDYIDQLQRGARISDALDRSSIEDLSAVRAALRIEYDAEIEKIVFAAREQAHEDHYEKPGAPEAEEQFRVNLRAYLEGALEEHDWLIYDDRAKIVLWLSDSDEASADPDRPGSTWTGRAEEAMLADCIDRWNDRYRPVHGEKLT